MDCSGLGMGDVRLTFSGAIPQKKDQRAEGLTGSNKGSGWICSPSFTCIPAWPMLHSTVVRRRAQPSLARACFLECRSAAQLRVPPKNTTNRVPSTALDDRGRDTRACLTQGSRISKSHMHLTMPCAWRRRTKYLAGLSRSLRWVPHCGLECSPFLLEAVSLAYCGCEQKFNTLSEYRPGPRPHRATTRTSEPQPIRHPVGTRVGY
jgi:hypothetical protein